MRPAAAVAALLLTLLAPPARAQAEGAQIERAQAQGRPLSAIDWLSESVRTPEEVFPAAPLPGRGSPEAPVSRNATPPAVTALPLGAPSPDPVGLLPQSVTGLPRDLWAGSDEGRLVDLVRTGHPAAPPAMRDLLKTLLLAEADPPAGASGAGALFVARIDRLLELGDLAAAQALLEAAGPDRPELFRRYFDVALLTGTEARACEILLDKPQLAPTVQARIFCLARGGDWRAAAVTLSGATALGDLDARQEALLTRFLDPDTFEGLPPLPRPDRPTPLDFRIREAIGERMSTARLPRAFAHADLRPVVGWKARLEAAERLARAGAVGDNLLLDLYTERRPAASGSVWDRAAAVQALETAIADGDPGAIGPALAHAWHEMEAAGLALPFARLFGPRVEVAALTGEAARVALDMALLSDVYETAALEAAPADATRAFLAAIARGEVPPEAPAAPLAAAVHAAFAGQVPPADLARLAAEGRLGEALLRAVALSEPAAQGDARALSGTLAFLRSVGLEETARKTALQLLILGPGG